MQFSRVSNHTTNILSIRAGSLSHYTSFGSSISEMSFSSDTLSKYRFGFNNQEKDDEIVGEGDFNSAEFWIYNTRLGRRLNLDPIDQINLSNYSTFGNNPIYYKDLLGNTPVEPGDGDKKKSTVTDAGHGVNSDPGACSGSGCGKGADPCNKEAELALKIEAATSLALESFGIPNTRTREGNISPGGNQVGYRLKVANDANADVLVSFHLDWEKGRTNITAVYQQSEGSSKSQEFENNSILLANSILEELTILGTPATDKVAPVVGNTRFTTLGVLNGFNGSAAILIEFGSVGDANNVELITSNADEIGKQIAIGIYKYLNGVDPTSTASKAQPNTPSKTTFNNWHPPMVAPTTPSVPFNLFPF